jgi:DNA replication protein DnaC
MGPVGTGKTHLAVAALQALITDKGVRGRFVDFTTLVLEIQMTFDGSGTSRDILRPLINADVLVVDELGAGKPTPWVMDLLYYLVNTRYVSERLTIFTTNYSDFTHTAGQESLTDRISARIRSRLFEMCRRLELRGGDYRRLRLAEAAERSTP